jgi:hypothetical protein
MRRRITWRSAAAISMLGLAPGIGAAFAVPAGATTNACLAAQGSQCGTFTASPASGPMTHADIPMPPPGGASGGLGWDVKGQSSAADTPLIEYPNYTPGTDPGTDLTKVEHYGQIPGSRSASPGTWYSIVFTPSGKWTSMCVANPDNKGMGGTDLVLRPCNQQVWQAFMAVKPGHDHKLPEAPTAPSWRGSEVIPTGSSHDAYAVYSVANGKFVEGGDSHMMSAADHGSQPRALSATGRTREPLNDHGNTNSWYWTTGNATH